MFDLRCADLRKPISPFDGVRRIKRLKFGGLRARSLGLSSASAEGVDDPMKRSSGKGDETPPRPITFRAAEDLGALELARLWADGSAWELVDRTQYDELAELAVMSALAAWLRRWQPIAIHGAILAGARPEAVAGALGDSVEVAFERWREWAVVQRDNVIGSKPGITVADYETVARRFAGAGLRVALQLTWFESVSMV
jgi:hypothetical protein